MKKIDYEEILKEARQKKEISPYTLVKRKLNYRKATGMQPICKYCKNINKGTIKRTDNFAQCEVVGEGFDGYSAVNFKFTCDSHNK